MRISSTGDDRVTLFPLYNLPDPPNPEECERFLYEFYYPSLDDVISLYLLSKEYDLGFLKDNCEEFIVEKYGILEYLGTAIGWNNLTDEEKEPLRRRV